MKKHLANGITVCRMLCSLWMLLCSVFSAPFSVAYLLCGLSDMADGFVARKTDSVTAFGARLDSAADLLFIICASAKLLPALEIPVWLWFGMGAVLAVRLADLAVSLARSGRWLPRHTVLNKVTGLLLFLLPLTVPFVPLQYSAAGVCAIALLAALEEGYCTLTGQEIL